MKNSTVKYDCSGCDKTLMEFDELELLKLERKFAATVRKKTSKDIRDELLESDDDMELSGFHITPSLNNIEKYDIDTNKRATDGHITFRYECSCGLISNINVVTDYSRPISADLELDGTETSDK